ncbi:MAG: hypothetical protein IKP73_04295 [Bacteroidales bacterium]|nr:hypothetical protein [Bacteroidales bacterium]
MCRKIIFVILTLLSVGAAAQHPFSLDWRVLKTSNAKFIYPSYLGFDAARLANGIDRVAAADTVNVGVKPRRLPILVSATSNTSNGYTTLSPYMMVLYTRPMDGTGLGSAEWFQTLLTHEYRHIVQYNMFDRGFTRLAHSVFGYMGWSALMYSVPQWFYEGDAVYAETVLSSQGRGRVADFERPISAILQERGQLYPYDKMIHRSYRDMIPNHYPIGYMMVTGAKRRFGADIFSKVAKRQSWYSFWPFAFGCGFNYYTGERLGKNYRSTFTELKDFYTQRSKTLDVRDYQVINNTKKRFYTSYYSPVVVDDDKMLCITSSMAKSAKFVVLDMTGRVVEVLGHSDTDGFDSDGNVIVYTTDVPDIRWSERNYSDIAVFDIASKTCQIVTNKQKYSSVSISGDGKRLVAVEFTDNRICKLAVLRLFKNGSEYQVQLEKSFYSRPMEFFRCPQFLDDDRIVFISNYDNKNSIHILDLGSMTVSEVTNYSPENIPEVCPSDDGNTLYYISDVSGIDNIHCVPTAGGESSQVTNVKYGLMNIFVSGDKIYFSNYTEKGYNVAYCAVNEVVDSKQPSGLNYYKPLLPKEPAATLDPFATEMPDTSILSKSKKYHQFSDPFRFLGWMPDAADGIYSATAYTANNLGTLEVGVSETYDSDFKTWRTGVAVQYSGFYPVINLSASIGESGSNVLASSDFWGMKYRIYKMTWKENMYSASVSLPFNLSRLWYTQKLSIGTGVSWYDIKDKPISSVAYEDIPNDGFAVWSGSASYSWARQMAYRDFKNPLSFSVSASVRNAFASDTEASMVAAAASVTVPGFFRQNYFTVSGNLVRQCQKAYGDNLYLFDHAAFDLHGYKSARMQDLARVSAEYSFPLGYPDFGIPSLIWIKRFRGSVFGDVARGTLFRKNYDFASVGFKWLADFCVLRLNYNITVGFSVAKGLKENGLDDLETGLILEIPFF